MLCVDIGSSNSNVFRLLDAEQRSNSILTASLIHFPTVLGASANLVFLGEISSSALLYFILVQPNEEERRRFVNESTPDLLVSKDVHAAWIEERERLAQLIEKDRRTDEQLGKQVFEQFDANKNASIDGEEITQLLREWDTVSRFVQSFHRWSKNRPMTLDRFYR